MIKHLLEIRKRGLYLLLVFLSLFVMAYSQSNRLFYLLVTPLMQFLPHDTNLIATQITTPFFLPIKLAFNLAILGTIPCLLYHVWSFTVPGLYPHERRGLGITLFLSEMLFLSGIVFSYYIILPHLFYFFTSSMPMGVRLMPDVGYTLDFVLQMFLVFGLCFQLPLICIMLVRLNVMTLSQLKMCRPYMIVGSFIIGMLLTPPDVISQIMLAVPLIALYELGLILCPYLIIKTDLTTEQQD